MLDTSSRARRRCPRVSGMAFYGVMWDDVSWCVLQESRRVVSAFVRENFAIGMSGRDPSQTLETGLQRRSRSHMVAESSFGRPETRRDRRAK